MFGATPVCPHSRVLAMPTGARKNGKGGGLKKATYDEKDDIGADNVVKLATAPAVVVVPAP